MFNRNKVMRLKSHQYRSHRFPPLLDSIPVPVSDTPKDDAHRHNSDGLDEFGFGGLGMDGLDDFGLDSFEDSQFNNHSLQGQNSDSFNLEGDFSLEAELDLAGLGLDGDEEKTAQANEQASSSKQDENALAADYQTQFNQGFQDGVARGHEEGVKQGIEHGKEQGYQEGLAQGQEHGYAKGHLEGVRQFEQATAPFAALTSQLQDLYRQHERRQREQVCDLVQKVAQQVIRGELALQPQQILALVEETLTTIPGEPEGLRIAMAPDEYHRIVELAPEKVEEWNIICDDSLRQGDCKVITKSAEADAGCQQRLDACMDNVRANLLDDELFDDLAMDEGIESDR